MTSIYLQDIFDDFRLEAQRTEDSSGLNFKLPDGRTLRNARSEKWLRLKKIIINALASTDVESAGFRFLETSFPSRKERKLLIHILAYANKLGHFDGDFISPQIFYLFDRKDWSFVTFKLSKLTSAEDVKSEIF